MSNNYSWTTKADYISVKHLGKEIGQASNLAEALSIEEAHKSERTNEAHYLYDQRRKQIRNSSINQRRRF